MKVHKCPSAGRLITVGRRWIANTLSLCIAEVLHPILNLFDSLARDTADVLSAINGGEQSGMEDYGTASFDVEALYPNIPQDEADFAGVRWELWTGVKRVISCKSRK